MSGSFYVVNGEAGLQERKEKEGKEQVMEFKFFIAKKLTRYYFTIAKYSWSVCTINGTDRHKII